MTSVRIITTILKYLVAKLFNISLCSLMIQVHHYHVKVLLQNQNVLNPLTTSLIQRMDYKLNSHLDLMSLSSKASFITNVQKSNIINQKQKYVCRCIVHKSVWFDNPNDGRLSQSKLLSISSFSFSFICPTKLKSNKEF